MPSKGTTLRAFRFADDFWQEVETAVSRRNYWTQLEPWTMSDFIRVAIREKLAKMERCRRRPGRRRAGTAVVGDQAPAIDVAGDVDVG